MTTVASEPSLTQGNIGVDDRGSVSFVNEFRFEGVKRFYLVANHRAGFIRAWHAHRKEFKYVTVVQGAAIVAAVSIDDWDRPDPFAKVHRHVLSAAKPAVLFIPAGHATALCCLRTIPG